jgi:hypothetical protein
MKSILDFLNTNSGAFTVLFSALVAAATIVYAVLTRSLVKETKTLRKAQTEPNVCAYAQTLPSRDFAFVIENIGMGPACDVTFIIEKDFNVFSDFAASKLDVFKLGIKYLAPSQKVIPFWFFPQMGAKERRPPINLKIKFDNGSGDSFENTFTIYLDREVNIGDLPEGDMFEDRHFKRELVNKIGSLTSALEHLKSKM